MNLLCPSCGSVLEAVRKANVQIDACPRCRGAWFDHRELLPIILHLAKDPRVKEERPRGKPNPQRSVPQSGRRCPHDHALLLTFNYAHDSNVFLDRCPQCQGIWSDGKDIPRLAAHAKANASRYNFETTPIKESGVFLGDVLADVILYDPLDLFAAGCDIASLVVELFDP
jgi:Zn-finger nucleic acid-binding protein